MSAAEICELTPTAFAEAVPELGEILHSAVLRGASVGFVLPFAMAEAVAFWRGQQGAVEAGDKHVLVAQVDGRIVATATLVTGSPPNGRHRAEIAKVLVHPDARRRGIARALMQAAETLARNHQRRLLVLDTWTGSDAERLYCALGWTAAGVIPNYATDIHGIPAPTTYLFKELPADA